MVVFGLYNDHVVEVEGNDGRVKADERHRLLVPAIVGVSGGVGNGAGLQEFVIGEEIRDMLAERILGHLVRAGLLGSDLLRGEMRFERTGKEIQEDNPVADRTGGIGIGPRLPRMFVGVVEDDESDAIRERLLECCQIPPMVFAELADVENIATINHEVFVRRMHTRGDALALHRREDALRKRALSRAGNGPVDENRPAERKCGVHAASLARRPFPAQAGGKPDRPWLIDCVRGDADGSGRKKEQGQMENETIRRLSQMNGTTSLLANK